jgi:SAM-dependent methyltransferase
VSHATRSEQEPGPELIRQLSMAPLPSFALLAGMELDLFTPLAEEPLTAERLADTLGVPSEKLELLLYALVTANLLELEGNRFATTPVAARFLARGSPSHVGDLHEGLAEMWEAAFHTADSIRTGIPQARIDFASMPQEKLEKFYRGFYGEALSAGRELATTQDFSTARSLVDVGGGSGGLAIAMTEAWPDLRATVADLPSVVPITERFVREAGAGERVRVVAADVVAEPPPGTYDVAVLRAVIQVLGPEEARRTIRNVAAALEPGGRIYIIGRILDDSRITPVPSVLSNVVFLNVFPGGRAYTESEHREWLAEAGFVDVVREAHPDGRGSIRARKGEAIA